MPEGAYPVRWAGLQAVATLPEHITASNADLIAEELLSLINRGAAELIADMTATASCDYAGADAVVRAYRRATASGTQLRLVVTAQAVRRVLAINGLDRLLSIYPSLNAAVAAGTEPGETTVESRIAAITPTSPATPEELLDSVVTSIFDVSLILQDARELPRGAARARISEALRGLEGVVRDVRDHQFAERSQETQSAPPSRSRLGKQGDVAQPANRTELLRERVVHAAHAMQSAAADTAALLDQQADISRKPGRIDYRTEVKRWRAFADQAEQMAKRLGQRR